jgi:prepilin signal peptidase PulO-like enzyme (type II secretory pathway)
MKSRVKAIVKFLVPLLVFMPAVALAQSAVSRGLHLPGLPNLFGNGLASDQTLPELIINIIELLLLFAGSIAVLFIIIGGFQYITSGGNEETAEKGRKTLVNAVIGMVVIILSYTIITVIQTTLTTP